MACSSRGLGYGRDYLAADADVTHRSGTQNAVRHRHGVDARDPYEIGARGVQALLNRTERRDRLGDVQEGHHHPQADHPKPDPATAIRVDRRQGPGATAGRSMGVLTWSPTRLTQKAADRFIAL